MQRLLDEVERLEGRDDRPIEECDSCGEAQIVAWWYEDGEAPICSACLEDELLERDRLREQNAKLTEALTAIHQPTDEEAEFFYDDGEPSEHCEPECSWETCAGHLVAAQVCAECGYSHDGEQPTYRSWPCRTALALVADDHA